MYATDLHTVDALQAIIGDKINYIPQRKQMFACNIMVDIFRTSLKVTDYLVHDISFCNMRLHLRKILGFWLMLFFGICSIIWVLGGKTKWPCISLEMHCKSFVCLSQASCIDQLEDEFISRPVSLDQNTRLSQVVLPRLVQSEVSTTSCECKTIPYWVLSLCCDHWTVL